MKLRLLTLAAAFTFATPALAIQCSNSGKGFNNFKKQFASYAAQNGVGKRGLNELAKTKYSSGVIKYDQAIYRKAKSNSAKSGRSFDAFYAKKTKGLRGPAKSRLKKYGRTLNRIEKKYGVPKEVLVTIWGMETVFGSYLGKHDVITSLASLSHNCRRPNLFRPHLLGALKIVDKRWMSRKSMRGARHGELGQTQFLAGNVIKYGVDFDGGGVDVRRSVPDVLASTANFLRRNGWQPGGSYQPGSRNFRVLNAWNEWTYYQRAIARFAASL